MKESFGTPEAIDLYEAARETLEAARINPDDFAGVFGVDEIRNDKAATARREVSIGKRGAEESSEELERKRVAEMLEAIVLDGLREGAWLGPDAEAFAAAHYDDIFGGTDILVRFSGAPDAKSYLGLAIDVTTVVPLWKKLTGIKAEIESGTLGEVKYVPGHTTGKPLSIARVVVAKSRETIETLGRVWGRAKQTGDAAELRAHPFQREMLLQIIIQLETFYKHAVSLGRTDIAHTLARDARIIGRILKDKGIDTAFPEVMRQSIRDLRQKSPAFERLWNDLESFHELRTTRVAPATELRAWHRDRVVARAERSRARQQDAIRRKLGFG